jgi:hypothetical protein
MLLPLPPILLPLPPLQEKSKVLLGKLGILPLLLLLLPLGTSFHLDRRLPWLSEALLSRRMRNKNSSMNSNSIRKNNHHHNSNRIIIPPLNETFMPKSQEPLQ